MGISANQARFLSLTARQCDLEQRVQQICQRRLRLSSELERIATDYNNHIGNRLMSVAKPLGDGINQLSLANLAAVGYRVIDTRDNDFVGREGVMNNMVPGSIPIGTATAIGSEQDLLNLINVINSGGAAATAALAGNYRLTGNIDLSNQNFSQAVINGIFTGTFDGNGYAIKNMDINAADMTSNIGFFSQLGAGAQVSNLVIQNAVINAGNYCSNIGAIAGESSGAIITNSSVDNVAITIGTDSEMTGGAVGNVTAGSTISNTFTTGQITAGTTTAKVGGFAGNIDANSTVSTSFSETNLKIGEGNCLGGFTGYFATGASIDQCYSVGDIRVLTGQNNGGNIVNYSIAGFIGNCDGIANVQNSYCKNTITFDPGVIGRNVSGFVFAHGAADHVTNCFAETNLPSAAMCSGSSLYSFANAFSGSSNPANSFYNKDLNNIGANGVTGLTSAQIAAGAAPISTWPSNIWGSTAGTPQLKNITIPEKIFEDGPTLEEGLRSGLYYLAKNADIYTQSPFSIDNAEYEKVDWRTVPAINDELFRVDDMDAENKYDRAVTEINSQDKKLQLEQSSVEVEYKAVVSEKEAVKKILDTNAGNSFKYFS